MVALHNSHAHCLPVQLNMFKKVQLSTIDGIMNWDAQPFPGRLRLIQRAYDDAVKQAVNHQAGG